MRKLADISYGTDEMQKLDLYLPEENEFKLFIYMHGGGIENGSRKDSADLAEYLTKRGIAYISVEYRMFPDARYPEFIEDCAAAVAWAKKHIGKYGRCEDIYVGGSSAGGYISMMLCFDRRWLGAHGISPTELAGFFHDAGQPAAHFNVLKYSGTDPRRVIIDETAPLYHIGVDPEYPHMHFVVSDNDMQNRYEQTMLVLSTLKHFGYEENRISFELRHGTHCHYCSEKNADGESVLGEMVYRFII